MGGDYGRMSFDALRDFAGVLIQQGHPILDSDWNEYVALVERRLRAQTVDTLGRAVVPRETPVGFQIALAAGPVLRISSTTARNPTCRWRRRCRRRPARMWSIWMHGSAKSRR
jgi:hypothetical protein